MRENNKSNPPIDKVVKDSKNSNFEDLLQNEESDRIIGHNQQHYIQQCSELHLQVNKLCFGNSVKQIRVPFLLFQYLCQLLKWFGERIEKTETSYSLHAAIDKALDLMKSSIQDQEGIRNICEKSLLYDFHGCAHKETSVFIGYITLSTYRSIMLSIAMIFGYLSPGLFSGKERVKLSQCLGYMTYFYLRTYLKGEAVDIDLGWLYNRLKRQVDEIGVVYDAPLIEASCNLVVSFVIDSSTFDNEYVDEDLILDKNKFDVGHIEWFSNDFRAETPELAESIYYSTSKHLVRPLEFIPLHFSLNVDNLSLLLLVRMPS